MHPTKLTCHFLVFFRATVLTYMHQPKQKRQLESDRLLQKFECLNDCSTMCSTAATICANSGFASDSCKRPSLVILVKSSPQQAYSITRWSFESVSMTSYSRITFGWWSRSILEISRDSKRCVLASSFVLSNIFTATLSVIQTSWTAPQFHTKYLLKSK